MSIPSGPRVRYDGVWRNSIVYVRVDGVWRLAVTYIRSDGVWKLAGG